MSKELVESAVEFLKNPQIANAPLEKKVDFLKTKGLNDKDIEKALKIAQATSNGELTGTSSSSSRSVEASNNDDFVEYHQPPPIPERDWKDYFIMATTTVSVGYGLYYLFKNVLLPTVLPQSQSQLESDKEAISNEFVRVQKLLDSLDSSNKQLVENDRVNSEKVDNVVLKVNNLILSMESLLTKTEAEIRSIRFEVERMISDFSNEGNSEIDIKLAGLQSDMESLRKLLNMKLVDAPAERASVKGGIPSVSSIPSVADILKNTEQKPNGVDRSSIPAWQLSEPSSDATEEANGKGKANLES